MSPPADARRRRTGRRSGESTTREAILEAARGRFADHGYEGATIRGIAADAGVDPALVHHFYGTKERLFVAAMRFPIVPSEVLGSALEAGRDRLGETLVRTVLALWGRPDALEQTIGLLRAAVTNEQAAEMLRGFVKGAILSTVAGFADDEDADYRASLVGTQILGLGLVRFVLRIEPVASASDEDLVASIAPTVQRYLTGDVRPPAT
jgi:AcrR family transcriptional regulator